jgi:ABC-type dipeptide/oligopeptide/nickel transport system permease component
MYATLTILGTFLSDLLLAILDPRIRYGERI